MPIKAKKKPTTAHIRELSAEALEERRPVIRNAFAMAGEEAVIYARDVVNTYRDQSGNLRSSIGFNIAENGKITMSSDFEQRPPSNPLNKAPLVGGERGKALAERIVGDNDDADFIGVLVAGMSYARYVQEIHHLDVLAGASMVMEKTLKEALKAIR